MLTVREPHGDEKVTCPSCFFTLMMNVAALVPVTFCELGATWIWPLLSGVAVIVFVPLELFS